VRKPLEHLLKPITPKRPTSFPMRCGQRGLLRTFNANDDSNRESLRIEIGTSLLSVLTACRSGA
jgi:hypothetical protein